MSVACSEWPLEGSSVLLLRPFVLDANYVHLLMMIEVSISTL